MFDFSYGGMLSAYMRFKYPNVIDAALAASAPIYMITFTGSEREFFFPAVTKVTLLPAKSYVRLVFLLCLFDVLTRVRCVGLLETEKQRKKCKTARNLSLKLRAITNKALVVFRISLSAYSLVRTVKIHRCVKSSFLCKIIGSTEQ